MLVRKKIEAVISEDLIVEARCDHCNVLLVPVVCDYPIKEPQFCNTAYVTLDGGGYGEFLDSTAYTLMLCEECARTVMQQLFPAQYAETFEVQSDD